MTDEVENLAVIPVPELEATAATPEPVIETPEVEAPKTFSQEELDAAIGKRLAREQRKWERDQAQRTAETQVLRAPVTDYSAEANPDALVLQKAEEIIARREAAKHQSQVLDSYHEREEEARSKYDDFEQVAYNPKLSITNVMAETIQSSDIGPELAYYLGSNPKDADRIAKLSPLSQAKEIGRIEAKLAAEPPMKKTTSAPAPITPVTARSSGGPAFDTTDPRSTKTMTDSQWIEAERARQRKKWESQNR
jgi:hypothetical protein